MTAPGLAAHDPSPSGTAGRVDTWARLDRWLTLGAVTPTYVARAARELPREAAEYILACFRLDARRTVDSIVTAARSGRPPSLEPAIFALALGASDDDVATRRAALAALPDVCADAVHLFQFVTAVRALGRGWGRTLKRAVADWYERLSAEDLADQAIRHRSGGGYSHKRLLQTAHPRPGDAVKEALFRWLTSGEVGPSLPALVKAHLKAIEPATSRRELQHLVAQRRLSWEALPREARDWPEIWHAMLPRMQLGPVIRSVGRMTALGIFKQQPATLDAILARLEDRDELRRSALHPCAFLMAHKLYTSGGRGPAWRPEPAIGAALLAAFHSALTELPRQRCRSLVALDVSESMTTEIAGTSVAAFDIAAAMAMTALSSHCDCRIAAFSTGLRRLKLKPGDDFTAVRRRMAEIPFGPTDCSLPIAEAMRREWDIDAFIVVTDDETWHGRLHPAEALRAYRRASGIAAKLVVVALTSNGFCLADPEDSGMLDLVGFDAAVPHLIADFLASQTRP